MEKENILQGLRVIDLADFKGVYCGKLMADMGAEVIKVELPEGDSTRRIAPFYQDTPGTETSFFHGFYNAGKKSVVLDYRTDSGKETLARLIRTADVLIETEKPGTMESMGLSYQELKAENPSLIYCSITAFGQHGPWADWNASTDTIAYAACGAMYEHGEPEKPPIQIGYNLLTNGANLYALSGILAELVSRRESGEGNRIDVSLFEIAGAWRGSELGFQQQAPDYKVSMRKGSQGIMVPANFYKCRDGHAFIMASGRWTEVINWMKDVGMDVKGKDDPKYLADQGFNKYLWEEIDEINAMVNELTGRYTKKELMEEGQKRRIPVGPEETAQTVLENPHYLARNYFKDIEHPVYGTARYPGRAFGFTADTMCTKGPAPLLGQHTKEILGQLSGEEQNRKAPTAKKKERPLEGTLVLDLGWVVAGPHAGRILEELGATVIRIESSTRLDPMRIDARRLGITEEGSLQEGGWCFQENNRNKKGLCLNMKSAFGKEIFADLVKKADLVVCNFAPAGFARMGLDYESLSKIRKDIIVINASGLGNDGPYSTYMTFAPVLSCMTGVISLIGYEGEEPYGYPGILADYTGGIAMAAAACAALYSRNKTGKGQFVDLAQSEALMQGLGPILLNWQLNHKLPVCLGNHDTFRQQYPHNAYECRTDNTWAVIAVQNDDEWDQVVRLFRKEFPEIEDPAYQTTEGRKEKEAQLDALMAGIFRNYEASDIAQLLQSRGISASKVHNTRDTLYDNPQAEALHYFRKLVFPDSTLVPDHFLITGPLIHLGGVPERTYRPGPACGQDNEQILKELLCYEDSYIKQAEADRAFI